MKEMEPANTFTLTLRGYQKQALLFVLSRSIFYNTPEFDHTLQLDAFNRNGNGSRPENRVDAPIVERVSPTC
jgi:hypothetical protein